MTEPHGTESCQTAPQTAQNPVRRIRDELGLSRAEFAAMLGVSRQRVYQLEAGPVGGIVARRLADVYGETMDRLGITVGQLLGVPE